MGSLDMLLIVGVLIVVCVANFVLMRLAAAGLRRAVRYFCVAVRPPSLTRLTTVVAHRLEEWQASEAAKRGAEPLPPPEIVLALRALAARERGAVAGASASERGAVAGASSR